MQKTAATMAPDRPQVEIIGVSSGLGGCDPACGRGPAALEAAGLTAWLRNREIAADWYDTIAATIAADENPANVLPALARLCGDLKTLIEGVIERDTSFAVLGGDHSCAVGTWSGAAASLRPAGDLGLVWIDKHMDAHVPETSPSGAYHGMPLACLLGHGEASLTGLAGPAPALKPGNVALIGVRSFEDGESDLLARLGVRVIFMDEVKARGLKPVLIEALGIAATGTVGFGLSIDLDALDPADAPGVGSKVAGGIRSHDLVAALVGLGRVPSFLGAEIVEYNPALDAGGVTAEVVRHLLAAIYPQEKSHERIY
jgi:arginase